MTLPIGQSGTDYVVAVNVPTITTTTYIPVPFTGRVKYMSITPDTVTATASKTFQLAYAPPGSTTFTNAVSGLLTVPSATAAGAVVEADLTPSSDCYVTRGGCLSITPAGSGTGGGVLRVILTIGA